MSEKELNWLLQTIKDPTTAERFVLAQFARGRISFQLMGKLARKRGWIDRTTKQFALTTGYRAGFTMTDVRVFVAWQE
jgi:hypothetical protein